MIFDNTKGVAGNRANKGAAQSEKGLPITSWDTTGVRGQQNLIRYYKCVLLRAAAVFKIHLKPSKGDQLGKVVDLLLGRMGTDVCPVLLIL